MLADPGGFSAGGGAGGGTPVPVALTTAPSTASLSTLIVTPPQVSRWPPRYWWIRWWFVHSASLTYGSPKTLSFPFQSAIQMSSGPDGVPASACMSRPVEAALP